MHQQNEVIEAMHNGISTNEFKTLLKGGYEKCPESEQPLRRAVELDSPDYIRVLLEAGDDAIANPVCLAEAISATKLNCLQAFIDFEPQLLNMAFEGLEDLSLLKLAFGLEKIEVVRFLLQAGAKPEFQTGDGSSVILIAVMYDDSLYKYNCLRLFANSGVGLNDVDCEGNSPMSAAIEKEDFDAIGILLEAGTAPHIATAEKMNIIQYCNEADNYEILKHIIAHIQDIDMEHDGKTLLMLATEAQDGTAIDLLQAAGAKLGSVADVSLFEQSNILHDEGHALAGFGMPA